MKKTTLLFLFIFLTILSCDNEPFDLQEPVAKNPISVDSELYNDLQSYVSSPINSTNCIEFIYPITINVFDNELEFVTIETILNKDNFITFLAGLTSDYSISVSYPIIYTNNLDEEIHIEDNEDLGTKLQECIDIELEFYCYSLLTVEECIWKVSSIDGSNNEYADAIFNVSSIGITTFEHNGEVIFGSWNVLASFNQLFFNINLDNESEASADWNRNWKVTIIDESNMLLEFGDSEFFRIEKICNTIICPKYIFEQCESAMESNYSNFDLDSFIGCFASDLDASNTNFTFFETEVDAATSSNPLISPYTNINNPQYIYIRVENNTTGAYSIIKILLVALSC